MRSRRFCLLAIALVALTVLAAPAADDDKKGKEKKDFANLGDVNPEVAVRSARHPPPPTPPQARGLRKPPAKPMQRPPPGRLGKVPENLGKRMTGLRDARAAGDEEKI